MKLLEGAVLGSARKNPAFRGLKNLRNKAEGELIQNILIWETMEATVERLQLSGISRLSDFGNFTLLEVWLDLSSLEFEYIVQGMKKYGRQFKDCNPKKEDPLVKDFKSDDTWLDNLLYRADAGSFALLRRITIRQLKKGIGKGLGPKKIALIKETLAKQGINIPD